MNKPIHGKGRYRSAMQASMQRLDDAVSCLHLMGLPKLAEQMQTIRDKAVADMQAELERYE